MNKSAGQDSAVSYFAESDYRFGAGPLRIRVERVAWTEPVRYDDESWYEVEGVELTEDGREVGHRQALVRGRSLAALRRNARP